MMAAGKLFSARFVGQGGFLVPEQGESPSEFTSVVGVSTMSKRSLWLLPFLLIAGLFVSATSQAGPPLDSFGATYSWARLGAQSY